MDAIKHFRDLHVYQGGKALVMEIFEVSKTFPVEERYALTDQVRRSCRSICANLAEAWRKRRYPAAFVAKLNDAETEASETQVHIEIAFWHRNFDQPPFEAFATPCAKIIAQVVKMIVQAAKWVLRPP